MLFRNIKLYEKCCVLKVRAGCNGIERESNTNKGFEK